MWLSPACLRRIFTSHRGMRNPFYIEHAECESTERRIESRCLRKDEHQRSIVTPVLVPVSARSSLVEIEYSYLRRLRTALGSLHCTLHCTALLYCTALKCFIIALLCAAPSREKVSSSNCWFFYDLIIKNNNRTTISTGSRQQQPHFLPCVRNTSILLAQ
jgi:hypothetical protein